jgi:hypothetical protein
MNVFSSPHYVKSVPLRVTKTLELEVHDLTMHKFSDVFTQRSILLAPGREKDPLSIRERVWLLLPFNLPMVSFQLSILTPTVVIMGLPFALTFHVSQQSNCLIAPEILLHGVPLILQARTRIRSL